MEEPMPQETMDNLELDRVKGEVAHQHLGVVLVLEALEGEGYG